MLDKVEVVDAVRRLLVARKSEGEKLDEIHDYWRGRQDYPVLPANVPREVRHLAKMSRVNMIALVVDVLAQGLFVDGFREPRAPENDVEVWDIWQANGMDARQIGVHRATLAYGAAYVLVAPGEPHPVMRGKSPRQMTAVYEGFDDEWPAYALDVSRDGRMVSYRLYDGEAVYFVVDEVDDVYRMDGAALELSEDAVIMGSATHDMGVCPVVRFRNHEDLDDDSCLLGEVEPLMPLQDQIDATTFGLMVAQHFQAFKQRYIIGWTGLDENTAAQTSASRLWSFEDTDVKVGEFGEVNLGGYLDSRTATTELLATISQTPPHHLLGKMINLSAEALAAAESGQRRKIAERETTWGESWEQALRLAASVSGVDVADDAEVRWRDTEARSLAATVDALGKLTQMLGVPAQELWERVPGVSQQDVDRWKATAQSSDAFAQLNQLLEAGQPRTVRSRHLGYAPDVLMVALRVFSHGGGVQSTAALVLSAEGRINFPVHLFANVGDDSEAPETLNYLRDVSAPLRGRARRRASRTALHPPRRNPTDAARTDDPPRHPERSYPRADRPSPSAGSSSELHQTLQDLGCPPLVAGTRRETGRPCDSRDRVHGDEIERANNKPGWPSEVVDYPLLDLRLRHSDCLAIIARAGLPTPPKSACWFCPMRPQRDWAAMRRDNPTQFAAAADLEKQLNAQRPAGKNAVFLTRFGRPLAEAVGEAQQPLFDVDGWAETCDEGTCFT